jgi:hypothetical protein
MSGLIGDIRFENNGDLVGDIDIYQYQGGYVDGVKSYVAVRVGTSRDATANGTLPTLNQSKLVWTGFRADMVDRSVRGASSRPIESICSRPCLANEYTVQLAVSCCWRCEACRDNEVQSFNNYCCYYYYYYYY